MVAGSGICVVAVAAVLLLPATLPAATPEAAVAHDLKKLRVEKKVEAVLWTRRSDVYTLQVVFPRRSSGPPTAPAQEIVTRVEAGPQLAYPDVRVWVLKEDGSLITPIRRLAVTNLAKSAAVKRGADDRAARMEVLYQFPLSAGTDAVAIAMNVDGEYRIEPVTPLDRAGETIASRELQALSGDRVSSVQWTRRAGYYTLQVLYAEPARVATSLRDLVPGGPAATSTPLPQIQVWLLLPRGHYADPLNLHEVTGRLEPSLPTGGEPRNRQRAELVYRFSLADGTSAEAVAIKVGKDYRIEKLLPLEGKKLEEK